MFIENSQLKDQLIEVNEQLRERTKDFALLVKDHNHKGEARDLIKKIGDLESIYAVLKEDIVYYTETVNSLTVDKGNLERRVAKLERTMADMEAKYKKEIDGLKFAHQQELQALTTEIEGQKRAITGLEKELKQERVEHEKAVERKDVEIRNMQTLLNDQRERAKRQEIEFLKQMQSLEQSISQLKEKFFKEKKELQERYEDIIAKQKESYEIQIQKMKDDAEAMQRMLEEQIKQKSDYIALLEEDYKKLKESTDQQIKKLSLELDHAHATIHQLQDQISKLEQLIADLKKENGDLHAKVEQLTEEVAKLKGMISELQDDFDRYKKEAEAEILSLQQKIQQLQFDQNSTIEEWKKKLEDLVIENEIKMREQINQITSKYELLLK